MREKKKAFKFIDSQKSLDGLVSKLEDEKTLDKNIEKEKILLGSYFFLSDTREEHVRTSFNIIDLTTKVGGFFVSINFIIGVIGKFINV